MVLSVLSKQGLFAPMFLCSHDVNGDPVRVYVFVRTGRTYICRFVQKTGDAYIRSSCVGCLSSYLRRVFHFLTWCVQLNGDAALSLRVMQKVSGLGSRIALYFTSEEIVASRASNVAGHGDGDRRGKIEHRLKACMCARLQAGAR